MLSLKEALTNNNRANAVTDLSESFQATREGNWIKIIRTVFDINGKATQATYSSFYGLENAHKIENLPKGWVAA